MTADDLAAMDYGETFLRYLNPAEVATLARCSAVGAFDTDMYDRVLCAPDGPELSRLVEVEAVEQLPSYDNQYRLSSLLRPAARSRLPGAGSVADPDLSLRTFALHLQAYCQSKRKPVDRVRALQLLGSDRAVKGLRTALTNAVGAGDVATCTSLLRLVEEGGFEAEFGDELEALARSYRCVLNALDLRRRIHIADQDYLPRPAIERQLENQLGAPHQRVPIQVLGSAGQGKSTLLRRLVTKLLGVRIAGGDLTVCAFLDFDDVDEQVAVRHPWLVVLEIVRQLDGQVEGQPLESLVADFSPYLPRLRLKARRARARAPDPDDSGSAGDKFMNRLEAALPKALAGVAALVVVDTFEKITIMEDDRIVPLIAHLRRLHEAHEGLRLVVSGREAQGTEQLDKGFGGTKAIPVLRFDEAESARYLTDVRHIERREIVDFIIARSDGLPWQLALDADVVERNPELSVADLDGLDTRVAWAINRIIDRIAEPALRWVVRYGCVPRTLTRGVLEVVRSIAVDVRAGRAVDDVSRDPFPFRDRSPVFVWDEHDVPDREMLWKMLLRRHGAATSWLSAGPNDSLRFADQLREPMCKLVDAQPVGARLRSALIDHYEQRVELGQEGWADDLREAVYQRSAMDKASDEQAWRHAALRLRHAGEPKWSLALADDLLGEDFEAFASTSALLAVAYLERAWANARIARRDGADDRRWGDVERDLNYAMGLQEGLPERLDAWTVAVVGAARELARGSPADTVRLLTPVVESGTAPSNPDLRELLLILADAHLAEGDTAAARSRLHEALDLAVDAAAADEVQSAIADKLAVASARIGDLTDAAEVAEVASTAESTAGARLQARIALATGLPQTALDMLDDVAVGLEHVEALIRLCRPLAALDLCNETLSRKPASQRDRAGLLLGRGLALGALLDVDSAVRDLKQAALEFAELEDTEAQAVCCAALFNLFLRDIGNLRDASHQLDEFAQYSGSHGSAAWVRHQLMRAELDAHRGHPDSAQAGIDHVLVEVSDNALTPRQMVELALAAYVHARTIDRRAAAVVLIREQLKEIKPASARLAALSDLDHLDFGKRPIPRDVVDVVGLDIDAISNPCDAAWLRGRSAELNRAIGNNREALAELDAMVSAFEPSGFVRWQRLQAVRRMTLFAEDRDRAVPREDPMTLDSRLEPELSGYRLLRAAQIVTTIELQLAAGRPGGRARRQRETTARRHLEIVEGDYLGAPRGIKWLELPPRRPTQWHRAVFQLRRELTKDPRVFADLTAAIARLDAELGAPDAAVTEQAVTQSDELALTVDLIPGGALVVSDLTTGADVISFRPDVPLVSALNEGNEGSVANIVLDGVRQGSLFRLGGVQTGQVRPTRLRIVDPAVDRPDAASLPWELLAADPTPSTAVDWVYRHRELQPPERAAHRVLQEALATAGFYQGPIDSWIGPRTKAALRRLRAGSIHGEGDTADAAAWRVLTPRLSRRPPTVLVLDHQRSDELPALAKEPVDVVHLIGTVQSRGSGLRFALGAGPQHTLAASAIDEFIWGMAATAPRRTPLLILDVKEQPLASSEMVVQLLRRNAFAKQVMAKGGAASVVATGGAVRGMARAARDALRLALAEEGTAADLVRRLQRSAPVGSTTEQALPWRATALFTTLHPDEMPPLGYVRENRN